MTRVEPMRVLAAHLATADRAHAIDAVVDMIELAAESDGIDAEELDVLEGSIGRMSEFFSADGAEGTQAQAMRDVLATLRPGESSRPTLARLYRLAIADRRLDADEVDVLDAAADRMQAGLQPAGPVRLGLSAGLYTDGHDSPGAALSNTLMPYAELSVDYLFAVGAPALLGYVRGLIGGGYISGDGFRAVIAGGVAAGLSLGRPAPGAYFQAELGGMLRVSHVIGGDGFGSETRTGAAIGPQLRLGVASDAVYVYADFAALVGIADAPDPHGGPWSWGLSERGVVPTAHFNALLGIQFIVEP